MERAPLGTPLKQLRYAQQDAEFLVELTGYGDIVGHGEQSLPRRREELQISQPDLLLLALRAGRKSVELLNATEITGVCRLEPLRMVGQPMPRQTDLARPDTREPALESYQ